MKAINQKKELAVSHPELTLELNQTSWKDKYSYLPTSPLPKITKQPKYINTDIGIGPLNLKMAPSALMPNIQANDSEQKGERSIIPSYVDINSAHSFIQQTWSVFSHLNDSQRDQLLKGLISRCSSKQIQLICNEMILF
jgi:adenylate cyclase